jgi:hypothetical protein
VSREAEKREIPVEVLAAMSPMADGRARATEEDPAGAAVKDGARKKNVETGAASIRASAPTPST